MQRRCLTKRRSLCNRLILIPAVKVQSGREVKVSLSLLGFKRIWLDDGSGGWGGRWACRLIAQSMAG